MQISDEEKWSLHYLYRGEESLFVQFGKEKKWNICAHQ